VTLLAVVGLAMVTRSWLTGAAGFAPWKAYAAVTIPVLLALAALTRDPRWSRSFRLALAIWVVAAPALFRFSDVTPAFMGYLTIGGVLWTMSLPSFLARRGRYEAILSGSVAGSG
jgi:hypothetical protein